MTIGIKFWGVRGSIACPSSRHIRYGGNTSCLEVNLGGNCLILDAGTGIRGLGQEFMARGLKEAHLLLTHTHWDHINGFPFFSPAYVPNYSVHIMAGHLMGGASVKDVLSAQMDNPMFPVPLEAMLAKLRIEDFNTGDDVEILSDVTIRTAPLNHPNGATGYRIEYGGRVFCCVTDTEHVPGETDQNILGLIEGADLVVYDSTYTEEEFPTKIGWGHSTWNEGVRLCKLAGAKRLAIFHHDPDHDDDFMDRLAGEAKAAWDGTFVAKEGEVITL